MNKTEILKTAMDEYSRIKQEAANSNLSVKPILVFNKEKQRYETTFMNQEYIKNFGDNYEIIKKD